MGKKSKSALTVPDELTFKGNYIRGWIGGTLTTPESIDIEAKRMAARMKERIRATDFGSRGFATEEEYEPAGMKM